MDTSTANSERGAVHAVVTQTADRLDSDPIDLEPLATAIDPELVAAFATSDDVTDDSKLEFRYNGCEVSITGSGDICVED